jgi:excisionase family DNA binding protein
MPPAFLGYEVGAALARTDDLAEVIAARVAIHVADLLPIADGWMSTAQAARYLGLSVTALHKLTSARRIPFAQDAPGGKCWFKRSELDSWRYG